MTEAALRLEQDIPALWEQICNLLRAELPLQSFLTWFRPLELQSVEGDVLTLVVPSRFHREWVESHYAAHLHRCITAALKREMKVAFVVDRNRCAGRGSPEPDPPAPSLEPPEPDGYAAAHLNSQYRFDTFVEGDCNRFARAAALALAKSPGKTPFNPLLIYGGAGRGKTHLMQAIGNHIVENRLSRQVYYVTGEQFTSDFIKAIQSNRMETFSQFYRNVDVLLLDDVQFFMAKDKTQEEFFHTFNALHLDGKQLVFSSDRPPRELKDFDERLVSRLQWGLVTELRSPEYETRMAILMSHAAREGVELPEEVAHYLATHITENIRTLQGAFIHTIAKSSLLGQAISLELAREAVKELGTIPLHNVSIERIQEITALQFGLSADQLRSKTRRKEVALARHLAMFLATEYTNLTLKAIGLQFGGRDHATVIHARETVNEAVKTNHRLREILDGLRHKLDIESY